MGALLGFAGGALGALPGFNGVGFGALRGFDGVGLGTLLVLDEPAVEREAPPPLGGLTTGLRAANSSSTFSFALSTGSPCSMNSRKS